MTNELKIREQIVQFYKAHMVLHELAGFPRLDKLLVYNECDIERTFGGKEDGAVEGYISSPGRFVRQHKGGLGNESGDRTIASLLAALHFCVSDDFNRFYSYVDESRLVYDPDRSMTSWLTGIQHIKDAVADFVTGSSPDNS